MPSPQASRPYIGGQAVLEGVMMRAPRSFSVVVRRQDGTLHVRERAMAEGLHGAARLPLIRGVATLVESLRLGGEALRFSGEQLAKDIEAQEKAERSARRTGAGLGVLGAFGLTLLSVVTRADGEGPIAPQGDAETKRSAAGGMVMLAVAIVFFVALPQAGAAAINRLFGLGLDVQSAPFQAITGALKLLIIVGYLLAIRRIPDIRRVFQYHGAEHKTISTYEAGEELTVANARAKTTLHPRCGTTFLVMVAIVSVLVFTAVGALLPIHTGNALLDHVVFFVEKLPFLPVLVAVTFEIQRLFARSFTHGVLRAFLWPGFLVQKITTAEPDDDQLEVALASLRVTLFRQEGAAADARTADADGDIQYPSYDALLAADRLRPASS